MQLSRFSRRKFLITSATATAAVYSGTGWFSLAWQMPDLAPGQHWLDLAGNWRATKSGEEDWISAQVPGCIHTDLLAAGKIPDPFFRENEEKVQWVGEANWTYRRSFQVPEELLKHDRVLLRCDGLDTLATVKVNGQELGKPNNMFRFWEFDVKNIVKVGENTIEVQFDSPLPYMKKREAERALYEWSGSHEPLGRAYVRKEPCNFGWDWGPVLITCGIWRNIGLLAFDHARIEDVLILQDHSATGKVGVQVEVNAEVVGSAPLKAYFEILDGDQKVASSSASLASGSAQTALAIHDPKLWWPVGMGEQPLYEVRVELRNDKGEVVDRTARRIGLRTLNLLPPDDENPLRFEANGVPFFAKGSNWIPADAFANRVTPEILRRYVADAVAVNMNALRFWGGGYYEEQALFDACDEMGICVWLDFKFACSAYPAFDDAFMQNVKVEAQEQLRRLRHHPCIAVWCGNNEISLMTKDQWSDQSMGRADYDKLFKQLIGGEVRQLAPQANYVSGSPDCGDVHYWEVWHGPKLFESYRTLNGFMSEFGFQSFPEPKTVDAFTDTDDRSSVMSPVMQWHQRSAGAGNKQITDTTLKYFKQPKDFENTLWVSQILQGYGIKIGAEHWRRSMPKSMGCLYWQYNDCWPVVSWSSVDYFGRWKALHYMARRFYAPILVSALEDKDKGTMEIHVTSDEMKARRGTVAWEVTDVTGKRVTGGHHQIEIPARQSRKIRTLDLGEEIKAHGINNLLVWLKLEVDGKIASENLATFVAPKEFKFLDPDIESKVSDHDGAFLVTLKSEKPALWCWLSLQDADARYSDNFMHLRHGNPVEIHVVPAKPMTREAFTQALRVRSLFDTYSQKA